MRVGLWLEERGNPMVHDVLQVHGVQIVAFEPPHFARDEQANFFEAADVFHHPEPRQI